MVDDDPGLVVDWRKIPAFVNALKATQQMDENRGPLAGWAILKQDQVLELSIKVTDPEIARTAILASMSKDLSLMPGMHLTGYRWDDFERKDLLIKHLIQLIRELDPQIQIPGH